MDFASVLSKSEPHQRTIIHLDMDYYYAQVEELRDPSLRTRPLGVQQKNTVVTCNYVARQFGVKKLMLLSEAKHLCPTLVLVSGEDLTLYRQYSQRIFELLLNYTPMVEKLGFDENFLDVTALVEKRREQQRQQRQCGSVAAHTHTKMPEIIGHIYPPEGVATLSCDCGCAPRLAIGTQIAREIRDELHASLGLTCSAGVSYNKLLAKLVGAQHKPNAQTVLVSTYAEQFMRELEHLHRITGIGQKTELLLLESGIGSVEELQRCDMDSLRKKFGFETATKLKDLSFGRDNGAVRPTGKPKSIGLEDSCRPISVRTDVEERFRLLLMRLTEQVAEDGRIPIAIKVILRKYDAHKKTSHRETKQANILPSLFKMSACADTGTAKVIMTDGAQEKILKIIMHLFERVVDLTRPFNITLIGLAFSKFQQRKSGSSSIANYLMKKTDLEVQSITSLTNTSVSAGLTADSPTPSVSSTNSDEAFRSSPTTFQPCDQFYRRRTTAASPIPMLVDNGSESGATNSDFSDFSETEVEPSPKKSRLGRMFMAKRRCLGSTAVYSADNVDVASPSKLRVSDLRLNSRDSEKDFPMSPCSSSAATSSNAAANTATCLSATSTAPSPRFRTVQPPSTLLNRIERMENSCRPLTFRTRQHSTASSSSTGGSPLPSPMDEVMRMPISPLAASPLPLALLTSDTPASVPPATVSIVASTTISTATTTITGNLSNIPCPAGVDPEVFNELPLDVQNELIASWRSSLAAAAAAVASASASGTASALAEHGVAGASADALPQSAKAPAAATARAGGATANGAQKNTLYRYFLRNK